MDDNLKDAADRITGAQDSIYLGLHPRFRLGVHAVQQDFFLRPQRCNFLPGRIAFELGRADADHVTGNIDAQRE